MPIYEYRCTRCFWIQAVVRRIKDRNRKPKCTSCFARGPVERILTVPHTTAWNDQEIFPNLHKLQDLEGVPGGMRFPSREAYDAYLTEKGFREVGVPRCKPEPGKRVYRYGKKDTIPPPPRGTVVG